MDNKLLLIANPRSGNGALKGKLMNIIDILTRGGNTVTVHITRHKGDATDIVKQRGSLYDTVVACGGDGTINEVVSGLCALEKRPVLGVIPCGSTNDYAATLGLPKTPIAAAKALMDGEIMRCDTGYFNGDPFAYCAAFGVMTEVTYQTPQELKNALGHMAYVLQAMKNIGSYRKTHLSLMTDEGVVEDDFILGMVTNTVSIGGFRRVFDKVAALDDGKLEITLVRSPKTIEDVQMAINVLLSVDSVKNSRDFVTVVNTDRATIKSSEPVPWTVDGEDGGAHTEVEISLRPSFLRVIRGREGATYSEAY